MAKVTGIPITSLTIEDTVPTAREVKDNVRSFTVGESVNLLDVTTVEQEALARLDGLYDVEFSMEGVADFALNKIHDVLKNSGGQRAVVINYDGTVTATFSVRFSTYSVARADDGSLTWSASGSLSNGTKIVWT